MSTPDTVAVSPESESAEAALSVAPAPSPSLDKSLVMGIAWTGGMKWATQLISWGSTIVVARLLTPSDFGILGMASVYLGLLALINDFGLTAAILKGRDLTDDQIAQIGGFGLAIGVFFTLISFLLATPIALFYKDPPVQEVVRLLSINFTVVAMGVLPRALLARDLRFDRLAWVDGVTNVTQIAATITLALMGFRYFSLVYSSLLGSAAGVVVALLWRGHRIAWPLPFHKIADSVQIGWHLVMGRVAWFIYQNADFAVVGRVLGQVVLGAYTIGWEVATVPVERISALVGQVTPSIFSRIQHDRQQFRRYYLAIVSGLAFLTFPAAVGVALSADLFVPLLLGEKWRAAIVPLRLLAAYAGVRSVDTVTPQVLIFGGYSRESMWFNIRAAVVLPILFYFATRWGAGGVAATWVVAYPVVVFPIYRRVFKILDLSPRQYFANLWPAVSGTAVMAIVILSARWLLHTMISPHMMLGVVITFGASSYAIFMLLAYQDRVIAFRDILHSIRA